MSQSLRLQSTTFAQDIVFRKPILLCGRHEDCDIRITSRKVSRVHCLFAIDGKDLHFRDLDSTNGVRLNGRRMEQGVAHAGDTLTVGKYDFYVVEFSEE